MRALTLILATLVLTLPTVAFTRTPQLTGAVSATFGVSANGSIPVANANALLRLKGEVGSGFYPDAAYSATLLASYDAISGPKVELDELSVTAYLGDLEVSAGKLRLAWGSTDGVNPVDALNPHDMTFPPENEKVAVPMLHAAYYLDDVRFEAALVPVFTPSRLPGAEWRAAPQPKLPPGASLVGVLPPEVTLPTADLSNMQFGVRARKNVGAFDVSGTYYLGFRHQPTQGARLEPTGTLGEFRLRPVLTYDKIHLVGVDFSGAIGNVIVRGEAAYESVRGTGAERALSGGSSLSAVLGAEYLIPQGPRVVLQGLFDRTGATSSTEASSTFKLMTAMTHEINLRASASLAWLQDLDGSGLLMPSATYVFADGLVGEVKAYVFYGPEGSAFGDWRDNSQLRASLAYSF